MFDKLDKKRIAFLCLENSCRSQIAAALANKLCNTSNLEFLSGGTDPADKVDPMALRVLKDEGIDWHGKPKAISGKEFSDIDIVVTMGCDVVCPTVPGARIVRWDVPDPKGKGIGDYRKTLDIIKENITELIKELES